MNYAQERLDKVEEHSRTIESLADTDDIDAQTEWRCLRAISLANDGQTDEAVELARAAVEMRRASDAPLLLAGPWSPSATWRSRRERGGAGRDVHEALELYRIKGDTHLAQLESRITVDAGA